jgi:hypothetical protein
MDDIYVQYSNYVENICLTKNLSNFKNNPNYTYMLEHVSKDQGKAYLELILSNTNITKNEIIVFCAKNDVLGNPSKEVYNDYLPNISVSPTSLRYIYHAHLILTHIKFINKLNTDIIEVGGGYGGLCLAIYHFAPKYQVNIKSYKICDLNVIISLQKLYLNTVEPSLQVEFIDAVNYGENINSNDLFLISNYCFSEISKEKQDSYIKKLFPKVLHGFIAWNMIPVYNFGFPMRVEPEIPYTGNPMNRYVYF